MNIYEALALKLEKHKRKILIGICASIIGFLVSAAISQFAQESLEISRGIGSLSLIVFGWLGLFYSAIYWFSLKSEKQEKNNVVNFTNKISRAISYFVFTGGCLVLFILSFGVLRFIIS